LEIAEDPSHGGVQGKKKVDEWEDGTSLGLEKSRRSGKGTSCGPCVRLIGLELEG